MSSEKEEVQESEEMVERQLVAWSKERCVDVRGQVLWSRFVF